MEIRQTVTPAQCAAMIERSRAIVALTGAGISTAAGIPDFRGPQGLYVTRRYDPEKVFDIYWFGREPRYFYEFSRDFIDLMKKTEPTFSHFFLAELERQGRLKGVITQNIDALHSGAGSRSVLEVHGSYRSATCLGCGRGYEETTYDWWDKAMQKSPRSPVVVCNACSGVVKPDIVFYGEPVHAIIEAQSLVSGCDLLLVLGSSLQVTPASLLPHYTARQTIIINKGDVTLAAMPNRYFAQEELDPFLQAVARSLGWGAE